MDRWEYLSVRVAYGEDPIAHLNYLGQEGWELASSIGFHLDGQQAGHTLLLKRPVGTMPESEPDLPPEEERWLRNASAAQTLFVLPAEQQDELLREVLTEEERECASPPEDFYERVQRYFAQKE